MNETRTVVVDVNQIRAEAEATCNYLGTILHDERAKVKRAEEGAKELLRERDEARDEAAAYRKALELAQEELAAYQVADNRRGDGLVTLLLLVSALSLTVALVAMWG